MGNEIAALYARIGADTSGLISGLGSAKNAMTGAASTMLGAGNALGGALKTGLGVAFGVAAAGAGVLATGLGIALNEAMDAQTGLAQLDAVLKSTGAAATQQADAWTAAQGKSIAVNKMSGEALGELQDKLEGATARLADLQFSWDRAKTKTETATRNLEKARTTVASLQQQIADGSGTIEVGLAGALGLVPPVARMTRDELLGLADALQKTTPVSADATVAGEAMLMTFTQIGRDVFPDATRTLLDMATAMNSGAAPSAEQLKSQAIQLGKALNAPADGLTALTRVGVTFSEAQKQQVKDMVAAGNVAGAQTLILKELQTEFGGSAEAAGKTFGGQLAILKNRLLDVAESIGTSLLPQLQSFIQTGVMPTLPYVEKMGEAFGYTFGTLLDNGRDPLTAITGALSAAFYAIADGNPQLLALSNFFQMVSNKVYETVQAVGAFITTFQTTLANTGDPLAAFSATFSGLWDSVQPVLAQFITSAFEWVKGQIPRWLETLQGWVGAFVDWVAPIWARLAANLFLLINSISTWVQQNAPILFDKIKNEWGPAALAWINVEIPILAAQLGLLVGQATAWFLTDGLKMLSAIAGNIIEALFTPIGGDADPRSAPSMADKISLAFVTSFKTGMDSRKQEISDTLTFVWNYGLDDLFRAIGARVPDMFAAGQKITTAWWDGLKSKWQQIIEWARDAMKQITTALSMQSTVSGGMGVPEARAAGGPVVAGRPYIVGEHGPELFVPGASGSIVNNTYSWNVNLNAVNGADSLAQMQAQAGAW